MFFSFTVGFRFHHHRSLTTPTTDAIEGHHPLGGDGRVGRAQRVLDWQGGRFQQSLGVVRGRG